MRSFASSVATRRPLTGGEGFGIVESTILKRPVSKNMTETKAQEPTQSDTTSEKKKPTASDDERFAVQPGMTIRVHQRITDVSPDGKERERTQVFEGVVLVRHGGRQPGATMTVRKISEGIGVERIFPLALPTIEKIEIVRSGRVRRARPYFLRTSKKKLKERKKK